MDCEPVIASLPDQAPVALHEVALVADQLTVELAPLTTVLGLAVNVTVGAASIEQVSEIATQGGPEFAILLPGIFRPSSLGGINQPVDEREFQISLSARQGLPRIEPAKALKELFGAVLILTLDFVEAV